MLTKLYVKADVALRSFAEDRQGVTAIEYAVVAVAVAGIAAVVFSDSGTTGLKGALDSAMTTLKGHVDGS